MSFLSGIQQLRESALLRRFRNKYLIAFLIFLVWVMVFDRNSLIDRVKYMRTLSELKAEKEYYLQKYEEDSRRLNELRTDDANLEKFAREQYLMKRENEDVFVIIEED